MLIAQQQPTAEELFSVNSVNIINSGFVGMSFKIQVEQSQRSRGRYSV